MLPIPILSRASWSGIGQDTWKVARGLTLNYGLRFSYDLPQRCTREQTLFPQRTIPAQTPVLYHPAKVGGVKVGVDPRNGNQVNQVLIGAVVPGSGNAFDGMVTLNKTNPVQGQGLKVGPRFGFAWDVYGDGKTSFRGGAGIYYNVRSPSPQAGALTTNPPNQENPIHPFGTVSQLFSSTDNSVIFPSNLNQAVQRNGQWPLFYNYSLGVQHALGFSSVLDIAYVGNLGRHLGQAYDRNAIAPGVRFMAANQDPTSPGTPLSDNFLRPYTGLGSIPFIEFGGGSNYNSLQVSFTRRFTQGFSIGANYVWSKALDYTDTSTSTCFTTCASGTPDGLPTFAPRHAYTYGLAGYDRNQSAVINFLWNIPKASSLVDNVIIRNAFDNWQLSASFPISVGRLKGSSWTLAASTLRGVRMDHAP